MGAVLNRQHASFLRLGCDYNGRRLITGWFSERWCDVGFWEQPPSKQWAALKFRGEPLAEVWFKPQGEPSALTFRIPQESFHLPGMTRPGNTVYIRPDQIGDPNGSKSVTQWFNTSAFAAAVGHFGTSRPGALLGPGYQIWDSSLMKNINFNERVGLQLRLETFNTFNHGSPSTIDTNIDSATYGQVTAWHDPRNLQIGAKLRF
jgi:hypothetical protein